MKALIYFPLTVLILCAVLSLCGLGSGSFNWNASLGQAPIYYDSNGHAVVCGNGTVIGEAGFVTNFLNNAVWENVTAPLIGYQLYTDEAGEDPLLYDDYGKSPSGANFTLNSSLGMIALVVAVMGVAVVAGITFFGIGIADSSAKIVVICVAYLGIWGVFSALTSGLLLQFDAYGWIIYFVLTILYTLGIISSFSGAN